MDTWEEYKKKNEKKFFDDVKNKFGDKFDLSKVEYVNNKKDVCIICPIHGEFKIKPQGFLSSKYGCPKCGAKSGGKIRGIKSRKTTEDFKNDAIKVHGNKYIYDNTNLDNRDEKGRVIITCPTHGDFWQHPNNHLQGNGCKECAKIMKSVLFKKSKEEFENDARKIHGDKYDYSKVVYNGAEVDTCIICPKHGEFLQTPHNHLKGHGCPDCMAEKLSKIKFKNTEWFKERAKRINGDKDDFSKAIYRGTKSDITIICHKHGEYTTTPNDYLNGHRCPYCKSSTLENTVKRFLEENGIEFEYQKHFNWLGLQSLDFYLPKYNIGIECQGLQHFKPIELFGGKEGYESNLKRDGLKRKLCEENGVKLLYYSNLGIEYPYEVYEDLGLLLENVKS